MSWSIVDATARAAWVAAETQQEQLEALEMAIGAAPRLAVLGSGGELSRVTLADPTINTGTAPRQLELGALVAGSLVHTATGTPTSTEVRTSGGTAILRATAGLSGATVNFAGAIKALCAPSVGSGGIVVQADGGLPESPNELDDALDIIAAAHANGQMWARLDNGTDTFTAAWPASEYRDTNASYPPIIYAWAGFAWDDANARIILWGGGHANVSANEAFEWGAGSRGWGLSFYGSEHINVWPTGGRNTHRVKGFNDAPTSSHSYCNNVVLPNSGRFLTFGGAAWNDGNVLRVFDEGIPGDQEGLRSAGAYSLDMTEAGTGKTAGATGTNAGTSLTGANAWRLHDWFDAGHASRPDFGGTTYDVHINRGAVAVDEGGQDVVYYTADSMGLLRSVIDPLDQADDTSELICTGLDFDGDGEVLAGGNLAMDASDRVIVALARGNSTFQPFRFVDLDATTPAWTEPTSPTGDVAALKAESKGEPGLLWDPIDARFVAATRGSSADPGVFPGSVFRFAKPARSGGLMPTAGWSVDIRDADPAEDLPPIGPFSGESFPTVTGKWRWANRLRAGLFLTQPTTGEVWAYIPENWTDPRLD